MGSAKPKWSRRREKPVEVEGRGPSRRTGRGGIQSFPLSLSLSLSATNQGNATKVNVSENSYPLLLFFFFSPTKLSMYFSLQ